MGGEDGEARTGGLVLVGSTERPEGNWAATELGEPALELRLRGVVGQAAHVENFATLREEGSDVGSGIHWLSEHVGVILWWLRFTNKTSKYSCKRDGLFHSTPWRSWGQRLQVKG